LHRFLRTCVLISTAGFWIAFGACDSELPPYNDPSTVFTAKVYGIYSLNVTTNSLSLFVTIKNSFDETLQGKAVFGGQLEIIPLRNPSYRKSFSLSDANLAYARNYNSASTMLTIDPGDSVQFRVSWDFIADNGVDLRAAFFRNFSDATCNGRTIALPEVFSIHSEMKMFDRIPATTATMSEFVFCYVNVFILPNFCTPVLGCPP